MRPHLAFLSLSFVATFLAEAYPDPQGCSGACGYVHDPYVVKRSDGTYFRFATFQEIQIATAPALIGPWTEQGPALPGGSEIPLPGNMSLWVCFVACATHVAVITSHPHQWDLYCSLVACFAFDSEPRPTVLEYETDLL